MHEICGTQKGCGLVPQEATVLDDEWLGLCWCCLCLEWYLGQTCGCLVNPDDVEQQAVSVLRSLDVQPHLSGCSSILHSPGWHAALQQCLEPIPILQTEGSSRPAVWHVPIVGLLARSLGPGWQAALQQRLEPFPILQTIGISHPAVSTFSL